MGIIFRTGIESELKCDPLNCVRIKIRNFVELKYHCMTKLLTEPSKEGLESNHQRLLCCTQVGGRTTNDNRLGSYIHLIIFKPYIPF